MLLRCAPVLSLQRRRHHHFLLFHFFFYFSSSSSSSSSSSFSFSTMSKEAEPNNASPSVPPPVAEKKPHRMEMFGDVRVDDYYWLRDDTRSNPQILEYLGEENRYAQSILNDKKELQDQLYSELRGRIQEDDISAPRRDGPYFYYTRTLQGKEYVQHCRRSIPGGEGPGDVNEVMPTGLNAPEEHIILDENLMSQGHEYYKIGAFKVNPNHKIVGYAEDTKGDEIYTMHVIDAETRNPFGEPLVGITEYIEWAGTDMLLYVTMDEAHRPYKVWRHKLGSNQTDDECLYHEEDDMFSVYLEASESKQYLFVASESKTTRFVLYLDVSKPNEGLKVLAPRMAGVDIHVSHSGDHFFIKRRTDETFNSEILICPVNNVSATSLVLPHRESVKIQDMQLFSGHMTVYERENGLPKVTVYNLPSAGEAIRPFQDGQLLKFADPVYAVEPEDSQYSSHILRFYYSSMRTPPSIYDYDMNTGICILKKLDKILGGFESANYATERRWAVATDGTQIPISIVYRKNLAKLDGTDPLLLYGYGSYEVCVDPDFRATRLSLIDRGFVYAIAHIRGGGEMGRKWYEDGKLLKKRNTFTDFITCAEYLLENKFGSKEKLCIHGRSAGGLLIGAVLNMRPDLFKAAVAGVPFVDVVTTMLDPSIPLTTEEWEEWGDPRKEEFYFYMKSYSPVDNIKPQEYPNILVTAGLNDPRVLYSEPAKYVAKLRSTKMDQNILLFKCDLGAGHSSKSGRFEKLEEDAFTYTFILKALDMAK